MSTSLEAQSVGPTDVPECHGNLASVCGISRDLVWYRAWGLLGLVIIESPGDGLGGTALSALKAFRRPAQTVLYLFPSGDSFLGKTHAEPQNGPVCQKLQ